MSVPTARLLLERLQAHGMLLGVVIPDRFRFDAPTTASLMRNGMSAYEAAYIAGSFHQGLLRLRVEDAQVLLFEARQIESRQQDNLLALLETTQPLQPGPGVEVEGRQIVETVFSAIRKSKTRRSNAFWPGAEDARENTAQDESPQDPPSRASSPDADE